MQRVCTDENAWKRIVECVGTTNTTQKPCGHRWEINEYDLVGFSIVDHQGEHTILGFVCPDCGNFSEVEKHVIPENIRKRRLEIHKKKWGAIMIHKKDVIAILKEIFGEKLVELEL